MTDNILTFGSNFFGQLGIGDQVRDRPPYFPVFFGRHGDTALNSKDILDIQCGSEFSLVLGTRGQVYIDN